MFVDNFLNACVLIVDNRARKSRTTLQNKVRLKGTVNPIC